VNEVAYATALVLAALFAWAGAAKLADRRRTATTFAAFGLPAPRLLSTVVPLAELALAAALVVVPRLGALAALVLLVAFTIILLRALARGVQVGCACFGSARAEPVSSVEVLRNVFMAAAAGIVLLAGDPSAPGLDAVILVSTGVAVAALLLALADLHRRTGHVLTVDLTTGPGAARDENA